MKSRRESRCPAQALKELNIKKWIFSRVVAPFVVSGVNLSHTVLHIEAEPHLLWLVAGSHVPADQGVRSLDTVKKGTAAHRMLRNIVWYLCYFFSLDLFTVSVQLLIFIMVALSIFEFLPFPNSNANFFSLIVMYSWFLHCCSLGLLRPPLLGNWELIKMWGTPIILNHSVLTGVI